jgi:hypothetical protein
MENTNYLTEEQIIDALNEMGETGSYKVNGNNLLIQTEENSDYRFYGAVESQEQVDQIFEGLSY